MATLNHTTDIMQGSYRIDVIDSTPFEWDARVIQSISTQKSFQAYQRIGIHNIYISNAGPFTIYIQRRAIQSL